MIRAGIRGGFTLVEVLLALAILGTGLAVLMTGASRCLAVMKSSRLYQEAEWTLCRAEADFPLERTNDLESIDVPAFTYDNGFVFTRTAEDEDEDKDGLVVVHMKVERGQKDGGGAVEVVRYFLLQKVMEEMDSSSGEGTPTGGVQRTESAPVRSVAPVATPRMGTGPVATPRTGGF